MKSRYDPGFGGEIDHVVRVAINDHSVNQTMTNIYGNVWTGAVTNIGRDQHITYNVRNYGGDSSAEQFAEASPGAKLLVIVGMILAVFGIGLFMFFVVDGLSSRTPPNPVPLVPLGFGIFFCGFVLVGAGSMWAAFTRRR
jgi:hypothetical protein